jgi:hypothetical protein
MKRPSGSTTARRFPTASYSYSVTSPVTESAFSISSPLGACPNVRSPCVRMRSCASKVATTSPSSLSAEVLLPLRSYSYA